MKNDRLTYLENQIFSNQNRFKAIGKALEEIRYKRLYKLTLFDTFEAYTRDRWDMGRAQAYRLINAYKVISHLSPIGDILPANEAQVRPLVKLTPTDQSTVWKSFLNTGMEKTAYNIKKFIVALKKPDKDKSVDGEPVDLTKQISKEYMDAVQAMLKQVQAAQNDQWHKTSRQAGLLWNSVIREKILSKETISDHRQFDDR